MTHRIWQLRKQAPQPSRRWFAPTLALLALLLLSACGGSSGPTAPDAKTLIQDAQKAVNTDTAFHFEMKLDHPGTAGPSGILVSQAKGDVVRPDKIMGTATATLNGAAVEVQFIGIGTQQWLLIPILSPNWMPASDLGINLGALLDPGTGASSILGQLQNPKNNGDDTVPGDGDCWVVQGSVPSGALAGITGGDPNGTTPIATTLCVAKNLDSAKLRQLYEVILKGIATDGDTAQTTRTITFSKFNETLDIEPPPTQ